MKRTLVNITSQHFEGANEVAVYGKCGIAIMLFTSSENSPLQAEKDGLIECLMPFIRKGKCKVYSIANPCSVIWESDKSPEQKSELLHKYNLFITTEVLPFIFNDCGTPVPIITCGAGKGAFHAANTFFRRPDIFIGTIAVSGFFDLSLMTDNYFDDNCYFNSPIHFLPNLNDPYWMTFLKSRRHIYISSGTDAVSSDSTQILSNVLAEKNIFHDCSIHSHSLDADKSLINSIIVDSVKRIMSKSI